MSSSALGPFRKASVGSPLRKLVDHRFGDYLVIAHPAIPEHCRNKARHVLYRGVQPTPGEEVASGIQKDIGLAGHAVS